MDKVINIGLSHISEPSTSKASKKAEKPGPKSRKRNPKLIDCEDVFYEPIPLTQSTFKIINYGNPHVGELSTVRASKKAEKPGPKSRKRKPETIDDEDVIDKPMSPTPRTFKVINFGIPHIGEHSTSKASNKVQKPGPKSRKRKRSESIEETSLNHVMFSEIDTGIRIFENIDTPGLFQCALVSQAWKDLAEHVLIKRWKGKMFEACKNGEAKVVELLLEQGDSKENGLNIKDDFGRTAFMWACRNGHKDVVQLLLDHASSKSNIRRYYSRWTACLSYNGGKDVVKLHLEYFRGIDLNAKDYVGWTAFMLACSKRHKDVVKSILEHSKIMKVNEVNAETDAAFMLACSNGHKDVIRLLLDRWTIQTELIDLNVCRSNIPQVSYPHI